MKVLFLDIDGVLNSASFMRSQGQNSARCMIPTATDAKFDPESIAVLNSVIEKTGAYIIVSSSWRIICQMSEIRGALKNNGFLHCKRVIGKTPHGAEASEKTGIMLGRVRGDEIQAWLDENPDVTCFAIVDDDSDMKHLSDRLVKTLWETGLRQEHEARLVELLT